MNESVYQQSKQPVELGISLYNIQENTHSIHFQFRFLEENKKIKK